MNKADKDRRLFGGWASVEIIDKQGEKVDMDAFRKSMSAFMDMGGNIIDMHSNKVVAKVRSFDFKKRDGKDALWLNMECYDHYKYHDEVWNKIKDGTYKGLSMGGRRKEGELEFKCDNTGCHNFIKGIELFEVSVVDSPANPKATIETVNQMAKSDRPLTFSMICPSGKAEPCGDCHIAKQSVSDILKPAAFDRCVAALENDPDIDSPHAVCQASAGKGNHGNSSQEGDAINQGGKSMTKDEEKAIVAKEEHTPPDEERKPDPEEEQNGISERLAALERAMSELLGKKKQEEDEEKPDKEEEEEEKGDAALTVKDLKAVEKKMLAEVNKRFDALKAPAAQKPPERPDMMKTDPVPVGEQKFDVAKESEASYREITAKYWNND